jgi:hypothetical protein
MKKLLARHKGPATGVALLLAGAFVASSDPTIPAPEPAGTAASTAILQLAVNAYASIGQQASCATYVTQNQGGTVTNNLCNVNGTLHDADLVVQMSGPQLQAELATGAGASIVPIFNADPTTAQVSPTISTPTSTSYTPLTTGGTAGSTVTTGIVGAQLGCAAAGALSSFFLGGMATEVTQLCNHTQLVAAYALQGMQYNAFIQSVKHLGSRPSLAINSALQLTNTVMRDIHGESVAIGRVVNGQGGSPQQAWASGTVALNGNGYLTTQAPGSVHLSNAASVNMTDAFSADALQAVGAHRQNQLQITAAVNALQAQANALDDDSNTPVAQQNITNAAILQLIKLQQSNAAVNAAILQQLTIANTWQRNAVADRSNSYDHMIAVRSAQIADYKGSSATVSTYLMP